MRTNPIDPYSKVLVLTGDNADDLVIAATALSLQRDMFESDQVRIPSLKMPGPRQPDDAPRWLSTDKITPFGDMAQFSNLESDGGSPSRVYMRLPPDLCYSCVQQNLGVSHELPIQRGSAVERQYAAGLHERRLCELDADAAHGQG